ncbi:Holliday junction resolvase RecU [Tepidibacter mesophilus]|nr:Holliday junction resolvase RecU [Tepidibacter mesophilus]
MADKGKLFEEEIIKSNEDYKNRGIALIQKISTPW